MKVKELIEELQKLPPDALVCIYNSYYQEYDTVRKGVLAQNSPFIGHSGVHYPVESWYWDDRAGEDEDDVVITVTDCVGIR